MRITACRVCGVIVTRWRYRPGYRPEPLQGGLLHACAPKTWRNFWYRRLRRRNLKTSRRARGPVSYTGPPIPKPFLRLVEG